MRLEMESLAHKAKISAIREAKEIKGWPILSRSIKQEYKNSEGKMRRRLVLSSELRERYLKECKKTIDDDMKDEWYSKFRKMGDPRHEEDEDESGEGSSIASFRLDHQTPIAQFDYHNKSIWRFTFGSDFCIESGTDAAKDSDILEAIMCDLSWDETKEGKFIKEEEVFKIAVDYVIEKHVPKLAKLFCKTVSNTLAPDIAEMAIELNDRFSSALLREIASQLSI